MGMFNNFPTAGGKTWWSEVKSRNGWKLQQNKLSGHYRILDTDNWRQWSGVSLVTAEVMFANFAG
jgi:hypothetical protein